MNHSLQEAARALADALNEACAIQARQQQIVETMRQTTESSEQNLLSFLSASQSDPAGEEAQRRRREMNERMRKNVAGANRLDETRALSRQSEQALCDSQIALMRLYAFPEAQAHCENIAITLRDLRLLPFEKTPEIKPPAPSSDFADATLSDEEQKKRKFAMAFDFMQGMSERYREVTQAHEDQAKRAEALLNQACAAAEGFAARTLP